MTTPSPLRPAPRATLAALVGEGSATHRHRRRLLAPGTAARDLADAVHLLCVLYGRHPGVIDHALGRTLDAPGWLKEGADGFARERALLAQLVAAAGPLPSTPGQAQCEAAVAGQRHALAMLARSERDGCAAGAAATVLLDWRAVREVLEIAAARFGLAAAPCGLPAPATILGALAVGPAVERAQTFAAQQVLAQHLGLWDLLEARAAARCAD